MSACPLCESNEIMLYHCDAIREYFRCQRCELVMVPPSYFLPPAEEKARYDLHENDPRDPRYRLFLSRLAEPLLQQLHPGAHGLDFGSGPGPTLSLMLTEKGFPTKIYDPFYQPDTSVWNEKYDFITASEVVEHLHHPRSELELLWSSLKPRGILSVMTTWVPDQSAFATWHYKDDPTHVIFFSENTFVWLSHHWFAEMQVPNPNVVLLHKP